MTQIDYHPKSACLLTNAQTFLYGSNASLQFECLPTILIMDDKNNSQNATELLLT